MSKINFQCIIAVLEKVTGRGGHATWGKVFYTPVIKINKIPEDANTRDKNKLSSGAFLEIGDYHYTRLMDEGESTTVHRLIQKGEQKVAISDMSRELAKDENINRLTSQHQAQIMSILCKAIEDDCSIEATQREELINLAKRDTFIDFLAAVSLFTFRKDRGTKAYSFILDYEPSSRNRVKDSGNVRDSSGRITDISQTILENSKNMFRKVDEDYKPNPDLCPELSGEIKKHTLIVSDGGAGKTTWMYKHFGELLKSYEEDSSDAQIPIYIELNAFDGSNTNNPTTGSFVKSRIAQQYAGLRQEDVSTLLKQIIPEQYVLLLDGMNEAKNSDALSSEIQELKDAGFHIILTSRRELNWEIREDFSVVTLERFSEEKINQILRDRGFPEATGRLLTTLDRPMFLALYLGLGNDAKGLQLPGELFLAHHKWIKKMFSVDKHGPAYHKQGDRLLGNALPKLATQTNAIVFSGSDVAEIFEDKTVRCDPDEALPILCETGIIIDEGYDEYEGTHVYRWKHEFFLQFYQAMRIWQQMGYSTDKRSFQSIKTLPQELFQKDIDDHVLAFLGDVLEAPFEGKDSIASPMSPIEKWLQINCQNQSIASKQHTVDELQTCTANLIKTMILARDGHLEYTIFDNLNLKAAEFFDCWLTGSSFSKCRNINQSNFFAAGHKTPPNGFAAATNRNLLFSIKKYETQVYVWDLSINKVITTLDCHESIFSITISPDERWLACSLCMDPHTIKVFDLELATTNIGQTFKIFRVDYGDMSHFVSASALGLVFFDSLSSILFCFHPEIGICKRWNITTENELTDFPLCSDYKTFKERFSRTAYSFTDIYCACSVTDKLIALRNSDIGIYDMRTGCEERIIKPRSEIRHISVTSNGERLVALANNLNTIYVYGLTEEIDDYTISSPEIRYQQKIIVTNEFFCGTTDSLHRLSGSRQPALTKWCFSDQELALPKAMLGIVGHVVYAIPNTSKVVCVSANTHILIVDLSLNKQQLLLGHGTSSYSTNVYFTNIKNILMRRYEDGNVYLLDISKKSSTKVRALSNFLHSHRQEACIFKFDGQHLFVAQHSGDVVIWDVLSDEYKDIIPRKSQQSVLEISIVGVENDTVVVRSDNTCFSVWKLPGHQRIGLLDESIFRTRIIAQSDEHSTAHNLSTCKSHIASTYCLLPEATAVAVGYNDGTLCVWDILSRTYFAKEISNVPLRQIQYVPHSSYVSVVDAHCVVSLFDLSTRTVISQWNALDKLCSIAKIVQTKDPSEQMNRLFVYPITSDISVLGLTLDFGIQNCYFVNHLEDGLHVGEPFIIWHPDRKLIIARDGQTALNPSATELMRFDVYNIPDLAWRERQSSMQDHHYDVSPDGAQVLCAFENGDIAVYGVQDHSTFMWYKSDTIDLSDCNFSNSLNLDEKTKTFLRMNDAIV